MTLTSSLEQVFQDINKQHSRGQSCKTKVKD